jgi:hypothetical protein
MPRQSGVVCALLAAFVVCGCAHTPAIVFPADAGPGVELDATPFFAQEIHQCGPAALAAVLGASGVTVTPGELVSQTYLPGRHGSLQVELIAAARRHQRVPYVLAPDSNALFAELDAGHPVLVLQDLGVGPLKVWHYAVVIGYEPRLQTVVLRSGTTRRLVMTYAEFVRSWRKSDQWAVVILAGDVLPATADAARYVESIVPIEALGDIAVARAAYATALARWPNNLLALFGLATTEYRLGDLRAAQRAYEQLLKLAPDDPIVLNNLAEVMLARGCATRAVGYAQEALKHASSGSGLESAIDDTRSKAVAAQGLGRDASDCDR